MEFEIVGQQVSAMIKRGIRATLIVAIVLATLGLTKPAQATSKEMIELQTQVQQLMDAVQRLQSTMDTKFGVLQHLVEQAADNSNQMNSSIKALQLKMASQNDALSGKLDTASGQTQSVNDSLDELKTRIDKLDKQLLEMQNQLQSIQAQTAATAAAPTTGIATPATATSTTGTPATTQPTPAVAPPANPAPPLQDTFQSGLRDYNAAHYTIAESEFNDVIHYYPQDDLAGNAEFYLGEIGYRQKNFDLAVKHYTVVLEKFNGNSNAAAAQLHKGIALIALKKREAGIHELRVLIARHPQSPEADQARIKLDAIGAPPLK
jgi:TolA-binding protein